MLHGCAGCESAHPGFTNVATNAPLVPAHHVDCENKLTFNARKRTLPPEQKSVMLMKDILCEFFKPDQLLLDKFSEKHLYRESVPVARPA